MPLHTGAMTDANVQRGPAPDDVAEYRRWTSLLELTGALAEPLTPEEIARHVLGAAFDVLGAGRSMVSVAEPDGRSLRLLATRSPDESSAGWATIPLDGNVPAAVAVRTGQMVVHASAVDRAREFPGLAQAGRPDPVAEASAAVPMVLEGHPVGVLLLSWDTERQISDVERAFLRMLAAQAAQALERARLLAAVSDRDERLQLALAASRTWLWEMDIATERLEWMPEAGPGPGVVAATLATAREWLALIDPAGGGGIRDAYTAALRGTAPLDVEVKMDLPDGAGRWFSAYGRAISDEAGRPVRVVGSARDITERKLAELEQDRRLATRTESARLREAFVAVVSHELRTPITTIFGGTRVLASRWRTMDGEARDTLLADVADEADRLYRLTEDIIVLTRAEHGPLDAGDEPVHVGRALNRALVGLRARQPGALIEVAIPADLPVVRGDETYLEHVLRNLMDNAAKYGGPGTTVCVSAEVGDPAEPGAQPSAEPGADMLVIRVEDEGPGINEAEAEELFGLFYRSATVASSAPGAGIGLFVCRRLVEAMGGSIIGGNRHGGGAVFTVRLPLHGSDTES